MTPEQRKHFEFVRDEMHGEPKQEQGEPVTKETASAHMTELLMTFVDIASMFPTQKPASYAWERVLIFAPKQEQGEPVAEIHSSTLRWIALEDHRPSNALLYTTPQQRTWVGLTDEDLKELGFSSRPRWWPVLEAKLKEKNT